MSWEIVDEKVLCKIKKQKDFEDQTVKKLTPIYESAQNPFIKLFIHTLILDTMRHSDTYQMLIELNSKALMSKKSKAIGEKELSTHIKEEAKMLRQAKQISEAVDDEKIKKLMADILEDEKKHHRGLRKLLELLKKKSEEWGSYSYDLIID